MLMKARTIVMIILILSPVLTVNAHARIRWFPGVCIIFPGRCSVDRRGLEATDLRGGISFRYYDKIEGVEPKTGTENVLACDHNVIHVVENESCATSKDLADVEEELVKISESYTLPEAMTNATVILNGCWFSLLDQDRVTGPYGACPGECGEMQIETIFVQIDNIGVSNRILTWDATGYIKDKHFDNPINFCYSYIILAWDDQNVKMRSFSDRTQTIVSDGLDWRSDDYHSVINHLPGLLTLSDRTKEDFTLPRGFALQWTSRHDHKVLQVAYNLGNAVSFYEYPKVYFDEDGDPISAGVQNSIYGEGFVSWDTTAILKDDDVKRDTYAVDIVSVLSDLEGDSTEVSLIKPPFVIIPLKRSSRRRQGFAGVRIGTVAELRSHQYVIKNIDFDCAVPILTGWDLSFVEGDEEVTEIGINVRDIDYNRNSGELTYTVNSILRDQDARPNFITNQNVSVLGINYR